MTSNVFDRLAELYRHMETAYADAAARLGLTCEGCADNCCTSYFQHHTYVEWAYFWQGLTELPEDVRQRYLGRARRAVAEAQTARMHGKRPEVMCLVNDGGRCSLYTHRLMICRLHGVPNVLRRPDGRVLSFPGCWRSQEICTAAKGDVPLLDRTPFYLRLIEIERTFLGARRFGKLPKVDLTLAEMMVQGPPEM